MKQKRIISGENLIDRIGLHFFKSSSHQINVTDLANRTSQPEKKSSRKPDM